MVKVETLKGVEAIAENAALPGVDAVTISPHFLTTN
jgi:2-keto-3-deoxy-L-rhamnonate aldolase RhmA